MRYKLQPQCLKEKETKENSANGKGRIFHGLITDVVLFREGFQLYCDITGPC